MRVELKIENTKEREQLYRRLQVHLDTSNAEQKKIALLFVRIKEFNYLEAVIGFSSLELLSKKILARLLGATKQQQRIQQLSLDTFLIVIPNMLNTGHLKIIAESLAREIRDPIRVGNENIELKPAIGITTNDDCDECGQIFYENALIAMQKSVQENVYSTIYQADFRDQMKRVWDLKRDIDIAIHENQFELYFQPKIDIKSMTVSGAEALIRWNHPQHGLIAPNHFIPIAEQSDQIQQITHWVIKSAVQNLSQLLQTIPNFNLSINISASNLNSPDLLFLLEDTISIWDVPPENLTLEVTETVVMTDAKSSLHQLRKIRDIGFKISIDDFGTGYSSLSYFKKIPATELKIDKSFVDNLITNQADKNIAALIIFLAKRFNLSVVAEGVESADILQEVVDLQCDYVQGFYFSKALPYEQLIQWMERYSLEASELQVK